MSRECSFELDANKVSAGTVVAGNRKFYKFRGLYECSTVVGV